MAALAVGGAVLGTMAGIAGARTQAMGAKFEGQVAAANALNEAAAYKFNAKVAEQQAKNTREVARAEAADFKRAGSAAYASRRARTAGSGVSSASGSPLLVDQNILMEIEFGKQRILNRGDIVETRLKNEASLLRAHAKQAKRNAKYALQGGNIAAKAASIGIYTSIAQGMTAAGNAIASGSGGSIGSSSGYG